VRQAVEGEVLVHLVGDDEEVVLRRYGGDGVQFLDGEHLAGRVVRGVQQDRGGAPADGRAQLGRVERPAVAAAPQRHRPPLRPGERDARGVRVVVRLEGDHLAARLGEGEDARGDRLGGAGGDQHLGVGVVVQPVVPPLVRPDGHP
jgi:hypothetical protein